jgi:hypothetical protein
VSTTERERQFEILAPSLIVPAFRHLVAAHASLRGLYYRIAALNAGRENEAGLGRMRHCARTVEIERRFGRHNVLSGENKTPVMRFPLLDS